MCFNLVVLWAFSGCAAQGPGGSTVLQYEDLVFTGVVSQSEAVWTEDQSRQVDTIVQTVRHELDVPSFAVGIVFGDRLVYAKASGYQALSTRTPATTRTLYHIGSVTKPVTATLLLALIKQGKLAMDDEVADYLPDHVRMPTYNGQPAPLTVRHLATHTAGMPKDPPNRRNVWHGLWLNPGQAMPYSTDALYRALGRTRLRSEPGTECRYSNYGYGLLGHVLERAAGEPLEQLMQSVLFEPLGMDSSTVTLSPDHFERFATHYWADDPARPRVDRPRTEFGQVFAHGGVVSSVEDLARWIASQSRGNSSQAWIDAFEQMQRPQSAADGSRLVLERDGVSMDMCIGWRVQWPGQQGGILNHSGEMDGHSAYVAFAPEARVGVIVLANLGGARDRGNHPTAAVRLGVQLKQSVLYPALGWKTVR